MCIGALAVRQFRKLYLAVYEQHNMPFGGVFLDSFLILILIIVVLFRKYLP